MRRRERKPAGVRGWRDRLAYLRMQKTWFLSWPLVLIVRRCPGSLPQPQHLSPVGMRGSGNTRGRVVWVRVGTQGKPGVPGVGSRSRAQEPLP